VKSGSLSSSESEITLAKQQHH